MNGRLLRRRPHKRRLRSGRIVDVRECWLVFERESRSKKDSYQHACPKCGANIISVHMPNGGWVHFEAEPGLTRIKHPCMHLGEKMGCGTDNRTLDLFEQENDYANL